MFLSLRLTKMQFNSVQAVSVSLPRLTSAYFNEQKNLIVAYTLKYYYPTKQNTNSCIRAKEIATTNDLMCINKRFSRCRCCRT